MKSCKHKLIITHCPSSLRKFCINTIKKPGCLPLIRTYTKGISCKIGGSGILPIHAYQDWFCSGGIPNLDAIPPHDSGALSQCPETIRDINDTGSRKTLKRFINLMLRYLSDRTLLCKHCTPFCLLQCLLFMYDISASGLFYLSGFQKIWYIYISRQV